MPTNGIRCRRHARDVTMSGTTCPSWDTTNVVYSFWGDHIPRFLIDDTTGIDQKAVYVIHTHSPHFIGKLVPESKAGVGGVQITGLPDGQVVDEIAWIDPPVFDPEELIPALAQAIAHHKSTMTP